MVSKLSRKKDTSEIISRNYSRKNRKLKKKKLDELIDLVGGDPNTIDKNKLSYTYLLGLKFSQLNRKKFKRLLRILFHFKLRSEKEDLQMDVFRNGIKMMKYYQKLLKYNDIYQKITNKLITSVMIINEEINNTILLLNKLLENINAKSSSIIDKNIIDNNTLLEMKIEYEAQKTKLNKLLLFRTDYALFRRNRFSLIKGSNIGYLIYLYRKAESKFNHIFYKFNEKTVNFINAMSALTDYYGKKKSRTESITKKRLPLEELDIEQFYDESISYEFLPKNEELRKYFALKNFNTQDELVKAIEEWLTHYEKIITDLPTQLNNYKKINTSINSYGIVNNPFSKPFFHKEIRKQNIHTPSLLKNLKTLIDDLKKVYMPDTSQVQAGGASIPISQAYAKTQYHPSSSTSTPIRFLTSLEIKERMNQLKSTFSSFIVNGTQFNLNILEEIQIKLTQLIGNILYIANHKKSKNLPTYVDYIITFLKIINDKLMKRNYNEIIDLKVLSDTFAKIILKNQLNLVKNISILISRLPESDTKNKVTLRYRNLRNQITELNMKVTTRIIKLNNGKPFSIDELPDGVKTQMGGTQPSERSNYNYNYECSKELTSLKHGIIKRLIGYFNTNFKEHAKLDMGYLSIEPEITYYNYDDELDARETGISVADKQRIKTKWYRLNQVYDRAFNPSHVDFEPYNKLRTRNFNMSFESFERINKFRNTETILKDKLKKAIENKLKEIGSTNRLSEEAKKKKKKEEKNTLKGQFKKDKAEKDEKIKTIMDINVIGRTKADKLGNRIKRTFGLNDSVKKINDITKNLEEYNDCNNFKLLGDKLVETYFINNIPLFADRLLRLRRDVSTENIINANNDDDFYRDISLPLGTIIFKKDNKHYDSSKNFNISYLEDLPTELKNDILVDKFIKKILLIPEKDLITMLTNFNQDLNNGKCPDDKSNKTVGDNDILKEDDKNFDKVYKGIFGYANDNNAGTSGSSAGAAASTGNPIKRRNESEKVKIPVIAYSGYTSNNYGDLAKEYPSVLFIYNDNFKEKYDKKEGNAIIRGRPNAFGIPIGAFKNDEAFETIEHSSSNKSNSINLDTKVIRDHCKKINDNNPTIRKILQTKLKELKEKVSPFSNSSSVFKAIVYTAKSNNSFDLNTETYGTENGTNNNITNFIRDEILKKISNHTGITGHTDSGITLIDNERDLENKLSDVHLGINGTNQLIDFNANFKNLYESPVNNNTIKVVNYKKKKTAVSTRFYQLKMKQLLVLICDRIKYYLNNEYPGVKDKDIFAYLLSIRNDIEKHIDKLNNYLFKDDNKITADNKINNRTILDKIASSYDMKKHNPKFYMLTRDLVKKINEETQLTNLLYVIDMVHRYCIE